MTLIQALQWRYAAKRMNGKKVSQKKTDNILEATRLSASSMGLQPYTILVVEDENIRKEIQGKACKQPQVMEGSHLLIFAAWEKVTEEQVHDYVHNIAQTRGVSLESLEGFQQALMGIVHGRTPQQQYEWAARQAYIAFGTAITAAAVEEVDATPMEGFNPEALDELLQLKEKGLRSVVLLALGYRDTEKDFLAQAKKVRRKKEELFLELN